MKFNILDANRWRLPSVRYTNYRKKYGDKVNGCFNAWFSFTRLWKGKLWYFQVKHHEILLDFRRSWTSDMMFGNTTKQEQKEIRKLFK